MGKPDGKRRLRRRRLTWEDNIKVDFREIFVQLYLLDSSGPGLGLEAGSCEHDNEHWVCI